jgi:hypothetical protein
VGGFATSRLCRGRLARGLITATVPLLLLTSRCSRNWYSRRDSNPGMSPCKGDAFAAWQREHMAPTQHRSRPTGQAANTIGLRRTEFCSQHPPRRCSPTPVAGTVHPRACAVTRAPKPDQGGQTSPTREATLGRLSPAAAEKEAGMNSLTTTSLGDERPMSGIGARGWIRTSEFPSFEEVAFAAWLHGRVGAPSQIRTDTERLLRPSTLPIGLPVHGAARVD